MLDVAPDWKQYSPDSIFFLLFLESASRMANGSVRRMERSKFFPAKVTSLEIMFGSAVPPAAGARLTTATACQCTRMKDTDTLTLRS